ncbi:type II CAAX endopeptidase family protein [Thermoanaerobacterium sp. RBIITD]|uniref:CPBP family intramembrane glutamic endopeptidase n=1 Tax=Thermoanaerobacterium sp. RBIITD TaxID=1550240 RepID=UPI000BB814B3|nr:type II CAAX endopeptidase family protein [Thermoanaerobacterium sp. RBIITD]SNX53923.1 hypothetical protein SAMN05660242_1543 [Thermoanaerobacterium sp. RBIITD]
MRPSEKDANKVYLLVLILFIFVGSYVQRKSLYSGLVITEFGIVLLPVILFLALKRFDIKYVLRFNRLKVGHALLIIAIMICGLFVSSFLGVLTNYFLSKIGRVPLPPITAASDFKGLIIQILIVSGTAALCEEILMRGLIMRSYEMRGSIKAVVISGIMFAALHLNIQNFLSIIFLGCLLGYVVHRTDSIFAGMLGHFTNNTLALMTQYITFNFAKVQKLQPNSMIKVDISFISVIAYSIVAIIFGFILYLLLKLLVNTTNPYIIYSPTKIKDDFKILLHWPLSISVFIFIAMIILEVLKISGSSFSFFKMLT